MTRVAEKKESEWKLGSHTRRSQWAADNECMLRVMLRHMWRVVRRTWGRQRNTTHTNDFDVA
jgi:hypothetical protein